MANLNELYILIMESLKKWNTLITTGIKTTVDFVIDCGPDNTVVLAETVYDDLPPVPLLSAKSAAVQPTLATFKGNISQYTFDTVNDEVSGASEVTHKYKEGTNIQAHIHWATNGVDTTDRYVKWELEYTIANGFEYFSNSVVISDEHLIPANTPDRTHIISSIGVIPGADVLIGAYICWRLRRIPSAGASPTNNPFGLAVGFHVEMDTIGSRQLYVK
jgi:hypothetical protein